jgi:hypothetical protein
MTVIFQITGYFFKGLPRLHQVLEHVCHDDDIEFPGGKGKVVFFGIRRDREIDASAGSGFDSVGIYIHTGYEIRTGRPQVLQGGPFTTADLQEPSFERREHFEEFYLGMFVITRVLLKVHERSLNGSIFMDIMGHYSIFAPGLQTNCLLSPALISRHFSAILLGSKRKMKHY